MTPGSVILSRVQQSDGRLKIRPALILALMPPYDDLLICAVSSKVRHEVVGFDELILRSDADFGHSGLKVDSLIRLGLLATIPASAIIGKLGTVSIDRLNRLLTSLTNFLMPTHSDQLFIDREPDN